MKAELIDIIEVGNTLGEGVTWDPRTGQLWWVDIQQSKLYRLTYASRDVEIFPLPERLGSFGLTDDPAVLICAFASGFALYHPEINIRDSLIAIEPEYTGTRMNDGRLDRQGRFFAGSMIESDVSSPTEGCGLYSIESGDVKQHFTDVSIANGLSWSTDGSRVYFADSPKQTIWCFDYDVIKGVLSNRRIFATTEGNCYPDGATVDAADHYWSAKWGAAKLVRYSPNGEIDYQLPVDAPHTSCAEFGGPEMDILFVTSAKQELTAEQLEAAPNSGHLFIYQTDIKGIEQDNYYPANQMQD